MRPRLWPGSRGPLALILDALRWATALSAAAAALLPVAPSANRDHPIVRAVWVADRDANALIELDADGFERRRLRQPSPLQVRVGPQGQLWCVSAPTAHAQASRELQAIVEGGDMRRRFPLSKEVRDVELDAAGRCWVLQRSASGWTVQGFAADGTGSTVLRVPSTSRAIAFWGESTLWVAAGAPGILAWDVEWPVLKDRRELANGARRACDDLVRAGTSGYWACDPLEGGGGWARRLGRDAIERDRIWLSSSESLLAASDSASPAWILGNGRVRAIHKGAKEPPSEELEPAAHSWSVLALGGSVAPDGALWAFSAGAVLRRTSRGAVLPGQGGFDRLTDLAFDLRAPTPRQRQRP